jgi:nucleotide-binding universal stress UspA family protein
MPPPSHYGEYYNVFANDLKADRRAVGLAREQAAMIESLGGTIAEIYSSPGERPGEEIVKNTRHEDVGLVVIGERGLGRFRYATRTSIAATVVRDSYCPVLVVRGYLPGLDRGRFDRERFPRRVLLATDGSPDAAQAARKAVEICWGFGSEVHVVHVWRPGPPSLGVTVEGASLPGESRGEAEERGRTVLDAEVRRVEGIGGTVAATHLLRGDPAGEVSKLGEEMGAELVVVGGRGSGSARGFFAGSVSRSIVQGLALPVLVVRGDRDRPARPLVEEEVRNTPDLR